MNDSAVPDTLWRTRLQMLVDAWPRLYEDAEALHQVRVASRRLREALPVLAEGRRRKRLKKARRMMRRITRALGPVRELDVAIKTLSELDAKSPALRAGVEHLREQLTAERAEKRAEMVARLQSVSPEKIERRLMTLVANGKSSKPHRSRWKLKKSSPQRWKAVLSARIARRARMLKVAIARAGAIYLPDRLHVVRVAVKKLRYAVEVGRDSRVPRTAAMLRPLKFAQDTLGHLHDFEVLIDRARAAQVSAKTASAEVSGELASLVEHLEQQCRQSHGKFIARRDELVAVCDQATSELKRTLAHVRPQPVRILRTGVASARSPRSDHAADETTPNPRKHDGRHA
jgi:CHAD domain-containing protein